MRRERVSATARLIAQSTLFLAGDAQAGRLVSPRAAELCALFVGPPSRLWRWAHGSGLRRNLARAIIARVERLLLPGIALHYALRKRYLEDAAREALRGGIRQIVVFGAGFDTLALRLCEEFSAVEFFELDQPATQVRKMQTLRRHAIAPQPNLHFIPLDLTRVRISDPLLARTSRFQDGAPTLFIAEGLLMYLSAEEVSSLFHFARRHGGARSLFAFTFIEPLTDGRLAFRSSSRLVGAWLRLRGEFFRWGARAEELTTLLAAHGFVVQEIATAETLSQRYLTPTSLTHLPSARGEHVCFARRTQED